MGFSRVEIQAVTAPNNLNLCIKFLSYPCPLNKKYNTPKRLKPLPTATTLLAYIPTFTEPGLSKI